MKPLLFLFLSCCIFAAHGQSPADWQGARYVNNKPIHNLAELAAALTVPYNTELEKVRSIFTWITDNISYKLRPKYPIRLTSSTWYDDDTSTVLKPLNERVAENVLRSGEAVCDGYARLFATLCSYANIRAEVITGYSRPNSSRTNTSFRSNHSWNAVMIDSSWKLLDVTWASGYMSYTGDRFIRHYSEQYFLTAPEDFIAEHYPENLQWSLLSNPPSLAEFNHTPFKSQRFIKSRVESFQPANGTLEAYPGDTLALQVQTTDIGENFEGTYDPQFDSSINHAPINWAYVKPEYQKGKNLIKYYYVVPEQKVEWLNLVLHDEVLLRYRLKVKDRPVLAGGEL